MSKLTSQLRKARTYTSKSSGFDRSHYLLTTGKTGTLVPVLCEEVLPRDKWSIGCMSQIDLPPAVTNFQGRVDMRLEAFFVPNRLLWGGWQAFISMPEDTPYSFDIKRSANVPTMSFTTTPTAAQSDWLLDRLGPGSLADYLGLQLGFQKNSSGQAYPSFLGTVNGYPEDLKGKIFCKNALPFLAYHRIYDDWYRDSRIQTPLFVNDGGSDGNLCSYPWMQNDDGVAGFFDIRVSAGSDGFDAIFYNGDSILDLHQRNWADDLYTTCSLYPQNSVNPSEVSTAGDKYTIPQLRMANIIQRFRERYNLAGQRYIDQMFAAWDIKPADAILQRPMWLGSMSHGVYSSPIFNTSANANTTSSKNPQNGELGSSAGVVSGYGKDSLVDSFTASEHGYIMVLASLVPHAFYSNGVDPIFNRNQLEDFADPLLQGLGMQPVPQSELSGSYGEDSTSGSITNKPFGYREQYATYKFKNDRVNGLFRNPFFASSDTYQLSPYCLQRSPVNVSSPQRAIEIDSNFLQIPINFLDQVMNVSIANSGWSWRGYFYFSVKCVRALASYVIPTLENTQHMYTHSFEKGGKTING